MSKPGAPSSREQECVLAIVDARYPGALDRVCRERDAWRGRAHIEWLDNCHLVLVVHPGVLRQVQR